jgi:hypothetical protein
MHEEEHVCSLERKMWKEPRIIPIKGWNNRGQVNFLKEEKWKLHNPRGDEVLKKEVLETKNQVCTNRSSSRGDSLMR